MGQPVPHHPRSFLPVRLRIPVVYIIISPHPSIVTISTFQTNRGPTGTTRMTPPNTVMAFGECLRSYPYKMLRLDFSGPLVIYDPHDPLGHMYDVDDGMFKLRAFRDLVS